MKCILITTALAIGATSAHARSTLLPSQDYSNVFSGKTCEDAGVLVNVQSALEEHLKKKVTLGSDIRLVMVRVLRGSNVQLARSQVALRRRFPIS